MGKSTISINQDFCYSSKVDSTSLSDYQDSLKKFSKNFDKAKKLKLKIPIFLDTNILLRYYSISFAARKQLYDFINENKKRIFLTKQVRYEFLRNREKSISDFFEQATGKIPKDFTDILNKIKNFLGQHKDLLIDYPFVKDGFSQSVSDFGKLLDKLNKKADEKKEENKDLILNDEFIELLNSCVQNEGLNNEEIEFVKKDFNTLTNSLDIDKIDAGLGKPRKAFPGMGDIKIKPEDSYGDFIIYHEMLKYVKNNLKDDAIKACEEALKIDPEHNNAKKLKEKIESTEN